MAPNGTFSTTNMYNGQSSSVDLDELFSPIPALYLAGPLKDWDDGSRLSYGLGVSSRYGLTSKYDKDWDGRYNSTKSSTLTASFQPTLSYRFGKSFSVAVGADLRRRRRPGPAIQTRCGFRRQPDLPIPGQTQGQRHGNLFPLGNGEGPDADSFLHHRRQWRSYPARQRHLYKPAQSWTIGAGAVYIRWSMYDDLTIQYDTPTYGLSSVSSTKNWNDVWRLSLAVEWQANNWMALRASYVYDQTPIDNEYADYLLPTSNRNIFGLGAGLRFADAWCVDVSYS